MAERLRNADAVEIIVLLELRGSDVSEYQRDDVAHDGGKIAPGEALAHDEVSHGTDESKVPVVPQVDVERACRFRQEHEHIDAQTDRNDKRAHRCVVGNRRSSRPAHVEDVELEVIEIADRFQRIVEVGGQQSRDDTQAHKADTHIESRFKGLAELHANAEADHREDDRHHD